MTVLARKLMSHAREGERWPTIWKYREREMGDVVPLWVLFYCREREREVVEFGERGMMVTIRRERKEERRRKRRIKSL